MYWISKSIHIMNRLRRQFTIFLSVLGPGIIVTSADNDAGGISTYAVTGSKYGFSLLWVILLLLPMVYYIQEMTVRLGAVTKRGHAQAIFEGFGPFWGWFALIDLAVINWLTLVTEYIGMTAAMSLFGVPDWVTYIFVTAVLFAVVVTGRYWTFEKIALLFCVFNLVYIPAAIWARRRSTWPCCGGRRPRRSWPASGAGGSTAAAGARTATVGMPREAVHLPALRPAALLREHRLRALRPGARL
ncbi:MAG TPA: divalent metal cation transporter, partial [Syntrophales bacterium]|nr:divalent metal cation transporter [Syntrophales bacterium]